jgi:hypothetical protein
MKERTYTISKPDGTVVLKTKDEQEAQEFLKDYKSVPPYGADRANTLKEFRESKDQLEYVSSGNYVSQFTYILQYYK